VITIADFRQKHLAAGGEGAPLAVYGDYLLFSKQGEDRIMLNIGGIANFTFLPGDGDASRVFSTDVGPGNTLMDHYVQKHITLVNIMIMMANWQMAGNFNGFLLDCIIGPYAFFALDFPKTTGPELFSLHYLHCCARME
jgi:anhydro-N-acetylmuramic acid kinase